MSETPRQHKAQAREKTVCAAITVSDTRTLDSDKGGELLQQMLLDAGHDVAIREIVRDEPRPMREVLLRLCARDDLDAVLMTGGTGISRRDQTHETVTALLDKPVPGYGELFRMLSYAEIGAAAMLSRATGGLVGQTVLLTMPGSPAAVKLAMQKIVLPELAHLVHEARK